MNRNVTDLPVLDVTPDGLRLVDTAPEATLSEICRKTGAAVVSCRLGVDHRSGSADVRVGRPPHGVADGLADVGGIAEGDTVGHRGLHDGLGDHRR